MLAPLTLSVAVCPEQIVGELTDRVVLFTAVTVAVANTVQPVALVTMAE